MGKKGVKKNEEDRLCKSFFERMEHTILWTIRESDFVLTSVGPSAYKFFGIVPDDIHSKSFMDLIHMVDRPFVLRFFNRVLMQHRFFNKNEQSVWFQTELIFDESTQEFLGISIDVSDMRGGFVLANVSSVLSSSLDFHMTLDKLAKIIVPFLGDWCSILIVKENGTIERAAAHHRDEEMRPLLDELLKYPAQRTILNSLHFQKVIRTGRSFAVDNIDEKLLKDLFLDEKHTGILEKLSIHAVMGVPIVYGQRIHGAIAIVLSDKNRKFDQQDLMTAEEIGRKAGVAIENALLYRTAQNAIAARDEFLSIASHELKTPITSLKLLMQMTRKNLMPVSGAIPNPDKMAQLLDQAGQQVDRLITLIEALLDVSRIEMGKIFYRFNPLNLSQLVHDLGERYREHLKTFHCELIMEIDEGITIMGDRTRIEQVVLNLLTNAAKYGEKKTVKMKLVRRENKALLSVHDEGIGIPQDKLEKIFDRFERIDQESGISGLGLGLYISREIVLAHMGRIWGESEMGKGSTFYVELPQYIQIN